MNHEIKEKLADIIGEIIEEKKFTPAGPTETENAVAYLDDIGYDWLTEKEQWLRDLANRVRNKIENLIPEVEEIEIKLLNDAGIHSGDDLMELFSLDKNSVRNDLAQNDELIAKCRESLPDDVTVHDSWN